MTATVFDSLVDAGEVAERLGVPVTWVREATRAGYLPHVRLGPLPALPPRSRPRVARGAGSRRRPVAEASAGGGRMSAWKVRGRYHRRTLHATAVGGMIGPCGLGTHTFWCSCQDALGPPAGALIAVLGGLCA
jgi:hypothetical protein